MRARRILSRQVAREIRELGALTLFQVDVRVELPALEMLDQVGEAVSRSASGSTYPTIAIRDHCCPASDLRVFC